MIHFKHERKLKWVLMARLFVPRLFYFAQLSCVNTAKHGDSFSLVVNTHIETDELIPIIVRPPAGFSSLSTSLFRQPENKNTANLRETFSLNSVRLKKMYDYFESDQSSKDDLKMSSKDVRVYSI